MKNKVYAYDLLYILLLFNLLTKVTTFIFQQLPVVLYESVIDVVNGRATMLLAPLTYTLAAEEAERIGVDHVARVSSGEAGLNSLGIQLFLLSCLLLAFL